MLVPESKKTGSDSRIRIKFRWLVLIIGACIVLLILVISTEFYSSDPIRGKVIDARTNLPVEGAIIAVDWLVVGMEGSHAQQLAVQEAVTNKDGYFEIPGWGPKLMKYGLYTVLRNNEPTLRIFKSEYVPIVQHNQVVGKQHRRMLNNLEVTFNNKIFKLEPFQSSVKEYASKSRALEISMNSIYSAMSRLCGWTSLPRFFIALHEQANIFRDQNIKTNLLTLDEIGSSHCGFAREVFKEYIHENSK